MTIKLSQMIKLMKTQKVFLINKVITIILNIKLSLKVEEEKKMHNSSEVDVIENMYNADADDSDGLIQQRKSQQTDKQPFLIIGNEYSDR